jgi:hypothetical protein
MEMGLLLFPSFPRRRWRAAVVVVLLLLPATTGARAFPECNSRGGGSGKSLTGKPPSPRAENRTLGKGVTESL